MILPRGPRTRLAPHRCAVTVTGGRNARLTPGYNNHQVHLRVSSHVKLLFIFVGYSEAVPLVEVTCGINLNNGQRNRF